MATPQWPLKKEQFWISQGFIPGHLANDLAASEGTPILSPDDGIVIAVNNNPSSYFGGNYMKIKGVSGYTFYIGHNKQNYFKLGDAVKIGQHIADVGQTGQATGPHIHFEVITSSGNVDPSKVITKYPTGGEMDSSDAYESFRAFYFREPSKPEFQQWIGKKPDQVAVSVKSQPEWLSNNHKVKFFDSLQKQLDASNQLVRAKDSEIAALKKQLEEADKNNGSFSDSDRATLIETNSLIKKITEWFKQIFKVQ